MHIDELIEALGGRLTEREKARWSSRTSAVHQRARANGLGRYLPPIEAEPSDHNTTKTGESAYQIELANRLHRNRAREARRHDRAAAPTVAPQL